MEIVGFDVRPGKEDSETNATGMAGLYQQYYEYFNKHMVFLLQLLPPSTPLCTEKIYDQNIAMFILGLWSLPLLWVLKWIF